MRLITFLALAAVVCPSAIRADSARAKALATQALTELRELGADMPFGSILYGREKTVRAFYKSGAPVLAEALSLWESDAEAAKKLLKQATLTYRQAGLLIPFYAIDDDLRNGVVQRYLEAENRLLDAIRLMEQPVAPPVSGLFRNAGLVWKQLGNYAHDGAARACRDVTDANAKSWRLPTVRELAGAFRAMKDPARNPGFGQWASRYREVWTADAGPDAGTFYYLHFQREQTGTAEPATTLMTVCVGDDAGQ